MPLETCFVSSGPIFPRTCCIVVPNAGNARPGDCRDEFRQTAAQRLAYSSARVGTTDYDRGLSVSYFAFRTRVRRQMANPHSESAAAHCTLVASMLVMHSLPDGCNIPGHISCALANHLRSAPRF